MLQLLGLVVDQIGAHKRDVLESQLITRGKFPTTHNLAESILTLPNPQP
jgi:hypothetical protein